MKCNIGCFNLWQQWFYAEYAHKYTNRYFSCTSFELRVGSIQACYVLFRVNTFCNWDILTAPLGETVLIGYIGMYLHFR